MRRLLQTGAVLGGAAGAYRLLVRGDLTLDVGVGRSMQPLGPLIRHIAAPPETVFDVIAAPYLGRTPRALRHELEVWARGTDMVLAAHHTPVRKAIATTLETVRFERPTLVEFRLVRGPVPHLAESFQLEPEDGGSQLPRRWYNVVADMPNPPQPVLHPGTGQPVGPDDLAPLFPMALILQEVSEDAEIAIPEEILDIYRLWRPTPLYRARRLEQAA